jgi:methyl-accepting chemotaxis protein
MMEIRCNACGKTYRIEEHKLNRDTSRVKCKVCQNIIVVSKPKPVQPPPAAVLTEFNRIPDDAPAQTAVEQPTETAQPAPALDRSDIVALATGEKVRFGLFTRILLVMLIVSLVPFAIFWAITLQETGSRIRNDTEMLMAETAKGLGNQVDSWINSNISILRVAAGIPEIVSMSRERQEPVLKAIHNEYPWMYLVFTVGPDGMNVARNDDEPLKDYSDRQYYKDIVNGKNLSWQTLIGKTSKKPALVLAVPIKSDDRIVGVMAAAMTVDDISKKVATWKKGKTGLAFLVDEQGFVIAHPNPEYVENRKNLNDDPLIASFRKKGWTTATIRFTNADGHLALGHVRMTSFGWALALQQDVDEVFSEFNRMQSFAYTLLGCTILLVSMIAWLSARAITKPINKLKDVTERMSLGDLNVKIDIKSHDEIGLLAASIERMQTSLRLAMNRLRRKH